MKVSITLSADIPDGSSIYPENDLDSARMNIAGMLNQLLAVGALQKLSVMPSMRVTRQTPFALIVSVSREKRLTSLKLSLLRC